MSSVWSVAVTGKPRFFRTPEAFGQWLEANHAKAGELVVGYWKVATGKPSMTWAQSVEQALRFGWIDGVRRSLSSDAYTIRFTPRKPASHWSLVNVRTMERLLAQGQVAPAGKAAWERRRADKTGVYSAEQRTAAKLSAAETKALKADARAWADWSNRPPSYRRTVTWWIVSAKKPETRARRLATLLDCCGRGIHVPPFRPRPGKP